MTTPTDTLLREDEREAIAYLANHVHLNGIRELLLARLTEARTNERLLREQIRVADVAFQSLHERHQKAEHDRDEARRRCIELDTRLNNAAPWIELDEARTKLATITTDRDRWRDVVAKKVPCDSPVYATVHTSLSPYHGHALNGDKTDCGKCPQDLARAERDAGKEPR